MTTNAGLQIAVGDLLGASHSRMTSLGRALDHADLRGAHRMRGRDAIAYALPVVMGMAARDVPTQLAEILALPIHAGRWTEGDTTRWAARRGLGTSDVGLGRTFGDIAGQVVDGDLQSLLGLDPACAVTITVDSFGPQVTLAARDGDNQIAIVFASREFDPEGSAPLARRTTTLDERLIVRLAEILEAPLVTHRVERDFDLQP